MIELLKSHGGLSYGQSPSHFEPKHVPPPIPKKCDWEIEPAELDFPNGAMIRKDSFGEIVKAYWEMRTNSSETYSFISLRRLTDYVTCYPLLLYQLNFLNGFYLAGWQWWPW
ncbi:PREDICTED: uncharacterized protein LOC106316849 isoform X2 [Brassica oleracea var. oleracea]|uniref:uncharacterized protein LOC106316849 isoform X2 n=1 Tax=Brassica oleracea var. oleracea TaxID=109376 RepID=UPI0006A6F458|nr:PREDICTED: uncharacterized protein LOC106316849 isoform X2 [Brassica oleracea var. oleracea]